MNTMLMTRRSLVTGRARTTTGGMSEPQPIQTAPQIENSPLLLYCPDQGGWHTGGWFGGVWFAYIDTSISLDPSHWMYLPQDPPGADL